MKNTALVVVSLMCIGIAFGGECLIKTPATGSAMKCRGQVYSMPQNFIDAVNSCQEGKSGQPVTQKVIGCTFQKAGWVVDGIPRAKAISAVAKAVFGDQGTKIMQGLVKCANEEESALVECVFGVYYDVCGHRTCDMINTDD